MNVYIHTHGQERPELPPPQIDRPELPPPQYDRPGPPFPVRVVGSPPRTLRGTYCLAYTLSLAILLFCTSFEISVIITRFLVTPILPSSPVLVVIPLAFGPHHNRPAQAV